MVLQIPIRLVFILLLTLTCCNNNKIDKVKVAASPKDVPLERGINISINYTDSGYVKARVFAPILERYSNDERQENEMKKGITAYFYEKNGKITSYIKSKYAVRKEKERVMIARNDVVVVNIKGDTLRTEELIWDEKTDKITSDKYVKITTPDQIIMGTGLESNTNFSWFKVFNITGIVSLKQ